MALSPPLHPPLNPSMNTTPSHSATANSTSTATTTTTTTATTATTTTTTNATTTTAEKNIAATTSISSTLPSPHWTPHSDGSAGDGRHRGGEPFHVVLCNPPYADGSRMTSRIGHSSVVHEPHIALFASDGGYGCYKEVRKGLEAAADTLLQPAVSHLVLEVGKDMHPRVMTLFPPPLWTFVEAHKDMYGYTRCLVFRWEGYESLSRAHDRAPPSPAPCT